ncbi:MAG TPA: hypothetical protein VNW52_12385 [Burkholderiaceae bacterium]|jgi:hypothetical protein|nr:hypothetical protein [Burkholderiaceae bacterium]
MRVNRQMGAIESSSLIVPIVGPTEGPATVGSPPRACEYLFLGEPFGSNVSSTVRDFLKTYAWIAAYPGRFLMT